MTKEELKILIEQLKAKGEDYADELYMKLEQAKSEMDTETRRKMRVVYGVACVICLVVGYMIGKGLA